jgi:hypothetical protein
LRTSSILKALDYLEMSDYIYAVSVGLAVGELEDLKVVLDTARKSKTFTLFRSTRQQADIVDRFKELFRLQRE